MTFAIQIDATSSPQSAAKGRHHRLLAWHLAWLGFAAAALIGCNSNETQPPQAPFTKSSPQLSDAQVNAVRELIEGCGGEMTCGIDGRPTEIDLASSRVSADAKAFEAALKCPDLKCLRLRAQQLPAAAFAEIRNLKLLEELSLQDAQIDDQALKSLTGHLGSLRRITLHNTPAITNDGMVSLSQLPELTHLALISVRVGRPAIESMSKAPALTSLDLRMCSGFRNNDLTQLAGAPKLASLKLGGHGIDNDTCAIVAGFSQLTSLTIEDASIDIDGLKRLAAESATAVRIRSFAFARCYGLDDAALEQLSAFPNLQSLVLRDLPISGSCLTSIVSPQRMKRLTLSQTFLTEDAFSTIVSFKNLSRLELASNLLSPAAIEMISSLSKLEYLDISACGLGDDSIQPLTRLRRLQTLVVNDNPDISIETVKQIVSGAATQ